MEKTEYYFVISGTNKAGQEKILWPALCSVIVGSLQKV